MPDESSFARLMESAGAEGTRRATRRLRAGEMVQATVIQIAQDSVFVDVGTPSDGRIARAELEEKDGQLKVKVGDTLRATVIDPRPDGPELTVSFGHGSTVDTAALGLLRESGAPVEGEVMRVNKGGVEVNIGQLRAFCPASQLELSHVADLSPYVGQKLDFKVIDVRDGGRSIVVSRRALLEDRRREAANSAKERLVVGSDVEGAVSAVGRHGAVVDLDGVEGFIHLSELAPHRVERAEDVVRVGERVRARVLSVEDSPKGLRVRLSLKAAAVEAAAAAPAPAEQVLAGVVTRAAQHGIFVQTPVGEGLVPLRELGLAPGADHRRAYPPGRQLNVVVVSRAGGRLTFSATQVARVEERQNYREFTGSGATGPTSAGLGSLGDLLRDKLKAAPTAESKPRAPEVRETQQQPPTKRAGAPAERGAPQATQAPTAAEKGRTAKGFSENAPRRKR
jgi:small subunit ribosomal protein S1